MSILKLCRCFSRLLLSPQTEEQLRERVCLQTWEQRWVQDPGTGEDLPEVGLCRSWLMVSPALEISGNFPHVVGKLGAKRRERVLTGHWRQQGCDSGQSCDSRARGHLFKCEGPRCSSTSRSHWSSPTYFPVIHSSWDPPRTGSCRSAPAQLQWGRVTVSPPVLHSGVPHVPHIRLPPLHFLIPPTLLDPQREGRDCPAEFFGASPGQTS